MRNPKPGEWLSDKLSQGFIGDYKPFMFVDGEGVRCSLYVSGCLFACEGCFNEATWNFRYGTPYTVELEDRILADLAQPYVQGLTLLGGEPFINTGVCLSLVRRVRATFGQAKDIWSWTGYSYEELLLDSPDKLELLDQIDILVDGRFDLAKKDFKLQFRGSSNQRIIDVKKSRAAGRAVLWTNLLDATQTYEQLVKQTLI
ncbi:anaerobic ribonucleoside-triphosphate reductase activating protein [Cryobacterium sp. MP_3.1]|uniref:anaerobic ribonucleoside-triphosphate reductase activating protein n=1 Tax=unclassified Cryobacterium TaxID=2649013 RepID=UPI000B4D98CD|nr:MULTISPECIES: anaerobic ribonucleoside-triphosphate reductase activating protein [unclassified Cryobacterium]ASD23599.1 anaerobic ribonucleoside-triphosphate reductase activating protein [Cryobacterium sp. LW097]MEC5185782.1 anaerobic ribonucleoside-triphosphate reductase activating protein [Cryobacterium sp. MP_3.1]TFC54742.1 anaerobic ribonucleoside-triphosphate reductase activating protein [Cryobacterium sp. TMB3-1-2]TFC58274.1 anaerobic ribonucleoside-triphosphate reductase activating pr